VAGRDCQTHFEPVKCPPLPGWFHLPATAHSPERRLAAAGMGLLEATNEFRLTAAASRIEPASGPEPALQAETRPPRIAIFTHDTFGLGHVRRCLHILRALARRSPDAAILLITGSPAVQLLEGLPGNADWVKIPTIVKTGSRGQGPPHLPVAKAEVAHLRERLIREAVAGFSPDVLLVDNFPLGSQG